MKISDEISLSARNLLRRKGRTALTLVGVVIGTCMVVLMISLGIAQTKTNEEMLQSWGDLTQVQIYGYGMMVGSDGKPLYLDDAAIASIKQIPHVAAATPYAQGYNLQGTITAGRNDRYTMDDWHRPHRAGADGLRPAERQLAHEHPRQREGGEITDFGRRVHRV
jgi:ABC-type lipoprotein release transport system permease subunit